MRYLLVLVAVLGCGRRNFNDDAQPTADAPSCPASFTLVPGTQLYFSPVATMTTWIAAQTMCVAEGSALAVPRDGFEALALADHIGIGTEVWVGISMVNTPGTWSLDSGEPATYLPWNAGGNEPDGDGPCARMLDTGKLADADCQRPYAFVCECRLP